MTPAADIAIIIPAYNEGAVLQQVVSALLAENKYHIIVVDDGSAIPAKLSTTSSISLLRHKINLGQGAALQTGISYAVKKGYGYIVTFDADGQHAVADVPAMLRPLQSGEVDITLASRFLKPGMHNASFFRKLFLKAGRLVNYFFTGIYLSDAHNGLRAFTAKAAKQIELKENRMAHATEVLFEIKKNELRWKEVPASVVYTEYSKSKGQSVFNSIHIFFDLVLHKLFE
jgi:glycosyltransferase involved in cell wall biosynthesis